MSLSRAAFFEDAFRRHFPYEATPCQEALLRAVGAFLAADEGDILVVNGYAGTGKTSAVAAVVAGLGELQLPCVLLAPTGRSAKVLSAYAGRPASTIHKHIYRQKSLGADGFGQFSLSPNKARSTLFVVDEVSLIGVDGGARQGAVAEFGSGNLLSDLIAFVRSGVDCRLLLVGDAAQLPPVGLEESPALSPEFMAGYGGVSFATLKTVVRQAEGSGILLNATHLRELLDSMEDPIDRGELGLSVKSFPDVERLGGGELLEALSDAYGRYGEDEVMVLCRSNKRAVRYNGGIRAQVQYREEQLVRGDRLMIVKNCYQFVREGDGMDYIANGDLAELVWIRRHEERYGLHFADACLRFPDYSDREVEAKVLLDTLSSESASLEPAKSQALWEGVLADYSHITARKKRYDAVREDPYFNALQLKYAEAITCHKAQGGQWRCIFIDNPFWQDFLIRDDVKWLYTAFTRAVEKLYLVNFPDSLFR